jgi:tRNA(Ile)-lysidine synthase
LIRLLGKIPSRIYVACSGGPDSMAALDFLRRSYRDITVCYFDHGTPHSKDAEAIVKDYCHDFGIPLLVSSCQNEKSSKESWEEYWRNERLSFFHSLDGPVVTGHTLDDVCEWWIFTSLSGQPRLIPGNNRNVIRPFMLTKKQAMTSWCDKNDVKFVNDPTNFSDKFMRSFIRKNIVPHAMYVNPGFYKVISKKVANAVTPGMFLKINYRFVQGPLAQSG